MDNIIKSCSATIGAVCGWIFGGVDGLLVGLATVMLLDYITGLLCAVSNKSLSSRTGFSGLCKKSLILVIVCLAHIVDTYVMGGGAVFRDGAICFYIANESLSVIENAGTLGVPLPKKLVAILGQLKNDDNDNKKQGDE